MNYVRKALLCLILLPYALYVLGAASNQLVIVANHGKFPVMENPAWVSHDLAAGNLTEDGMTDDVHCIMTPETHLNFLADVFDFRDKIESIGDLLIDSGSLIHDYSFFILAGLILFKKE
jgi:hypothetical protein